jgi:hypothetical protein
MFILHQREYMDLNPALQAGFSQDEPSALQTATGQLYLALVSILEPPRAESPKCESLG